MNGHIYIVIPVFKRVEITKNCLDSLMKQDYKDYTIVLVDHCTADNSYSELLKTVNYPGLILVKGEDSMWWTEATNHGIQYVLTNLQVVVENDFILTLNNDLSVESDYLSQLIKVYEKFRPCVVGSVSVDGDNPEKIDFAGCIWNKFTTRIRSAVNISTPYTEIVDRDTIASDLLPGRGTLFPIKLIYEIGFYDEKKFPHYASDYDFSYRARKAGYKLIVATRALVKSAVGETGMRFDKNSRVIPSLKFFWGTQTSIKSPTNIKTRYNWAMKHSKFPLGYFFVDTLRVLAAYGRYGIKYYKKNI